MKPHYVSVEGRAMKYQVINRYGIKGGSKHRTPEAACKAARRFSGEGWIVIDENGNQWTMCDKRAVKI